MRKWKEEREKKRESEWGRERFRDDGNYTCSIKRVFLLSGTPSKSGNPSTQWFVLTGRDFFVFLCVDHKKVNVTPNTKKGDWLLFSLSFSVCFFLLLVFYCASFFCLSFCNISFLLFVCMTVFSVSKSCISNFKNEKLFLF